MKISIEWEASDIWDGLNVFYPGRSPEAYTIRYCEGGLGCDPNLQYVKVWDDLTGTLVLACSLITLVNLMNNDPNIILPVFTSQLEAQCVNSSLHSKRIFRIL